MQKNKDGDRYIDVGSELYTLQYSIAQIVAAAGLTIQLKGNKRATVRQFKGKTLVDIREVSCIRGHRMQKYGARRLLRVLILQFYSDKSTGEMLPGKKGISLSVEQVCASRSKYW